MRRFRRLRSAYYFVLACRQAVRPPVDDAALDAWYATREDPWSYESEPAERQRYALALEMLDGTAPQDRPRGLEIGCGEGLFTAELAGRCESLLAVDLSAVALERARLRLEDASNVRFERVDISARPALGAFDLIVCMDVLDDLHRPLAFRRSLDEVIGSLAPGGRLLTSAVIQSPIVEGASWARWLSRGAGNIMAAVAGAGEELERTRFRSTAQHSVALFTRG